MKFYTIHEFSELVGKTPQTLRNWDNKNILKPHHTSTNGYRYYSSDQVNQVLNINYIETNDKLDNIFVNTIITICNLYKDNVTNKLQDKINNILKLMEESEVNGENDKGNKSNVNTE